MFWGIQISVWHPFNVIFQRNIEPKENVVVNTWTTVASVLVPTEDDISKTLEYLEKDTLYRHVESICDKLGGRVAYTKTDPLAGKCLRIIHFPNERVLWIANTHG